MAGLLQSTTCTPSRQNCPLTIGELSKLFGDPKKRAHLVVNKPGAGYSMGAAAADYDNDGKADLFVAGVYRNILHHNMGNGKFVDVTAKSGIKNDRWSVAAGWFDYDNDGLLDLFVANYAKWTPAFDQYCGDATRSLRVYCHPKYFEGVPN